MDYKVVVTKDAEEDLERFIKYLLFEKKSLQAAENVLNDYDATIESLRHVASSKEYLDFILEQLSELYEGAKEMVLI